MYTCSIATLYNYVVIDLIIRVIELQHRSEESMRV